MQTVSTITELASKRTWASMQEVSDEALIESIADGDKRAMQMLFGRHNVWDPLESTCRHASLSIL